MLRGIAMLSTIATIGSIFADGAHASTWGELAPLPDLFALQDAGSAAAGTPSLAPGIVLTTAADARAVPVFIDPLSDQEVASQLVEQNLVKVVTTKEGITTRS